MNTDYEELFENIESLEIEQLLAVVDDTGMLAGQEVSNLIILIQELGSRLSTVLNVQQDFQETVHEYNE